MKKAKYILYVLSMVITSIAFASNPETKKDSDPKDRAEQLENRVYEIWEMDFSDMEKEEKAAIKTELKEIKKELKQTSLDKKVSISVGAIIIILLLIIIIT